MKHILLISLVLIGLVVFGVIYFQNTLDGYDSSDIDSDIQKSQGNEDTHEINDGMEEENDLANRAEDEGYKAITPSLTLPVNGEDVIYEYVGIWPFGIVNDLKPDGHPGIDFDTSVGSPIFAAEDGVVSQVGVSTQEDFSTISINHGDSYSTFYTGTISDISISDNEKVAKGQQIATLAFFEEGEEYGSQVHFHFELFDRKNKKSVCPFTFMDSIAKEKLEEIHKKSVYQEKNEFPNICN